MKRTFRRAAAGILCACLVCSNAYAFTYTELDNSKVFSDEILQKEQVSSWAKEDVEAARELGLIPALTGNPGYKDKITREQFAELVVQTVDVIVEKELESADAGTFSDTSNDKILIAYNLGIVDGVGDGKFAPSSTTNREQIATMVARAVKSVNELTGVNLAPVQGDLTKFSDRDKVSGWAKEGVGTLAANGIMEGTSATTLEPKNSCTVEQSILLLYRLYNNYQEAK
ncbi:MAG: S-layer homology domain-containing protein [Anaerovoracaceae bacterium]